MRDWLKRLDRTIAESYEEYERNVLAYDAEIDGLDALLARNEEYQDAQ